MSYLDVPRIHFSGRFFTDPSTVNNDPTHYDPATTRPSPWQEPEGQHRYQLRDCTVKSAMGPNGFVGNDDVIGASVLTTDQPDPARIVDLDVYQQGVPTIYGLQLQIKLSNGQSITGTMDPATLNSLWPNAVLPTRSWAEGDYGWGSYGGDMDMAGCFQTVVRFDPANWPNTSSQVLQQLRAATITVNGQLLLSLKFVVDGYHNVPQDSNFHFGRIVGTLGPVKANEPLYNPGQRWLVPRAFGETDPWYYPSFNGGPFKVDAVRKKLILDLANCICRQTAGGPPVDLGVLQAMVKFLDPPDMVIGTVVYSQFAYDNNALITELDLSDEQLQILQHNPLSLVMSRTDLGPQVVLSEDPSGLAYAVEVRPIRMAGDTGTTATTQVHVTQWGVPLANKQLALFIEEVHGNTPGATVPRTNPGDTPQAKGVLAPPTTFITATDAYGFATATLQVLKDPGQRTPELDGQLYFIIVYDPAQPHPDWSQVPPQQEHLISCVVWSQYQVNPNPAWQEIQAMMAPYMKLYPSMKNQIDLTDLHSFTIFAKNPPWSKVYNAPPEPYLGIDNGAIPFYLTRDFTDPRFMPISRDLSPNRIKTILHFVKNLQEGKVPSAT